MTRTLAMAAAALASVTIAAACSSRDPDTQKMANDIAARSTSATQQRLWRDAASRNLTRGLAKVPVAARPIEKRAHATVPNRAELQSPIVIPPDVDTDLRIVSTPPVPGNSATGKARVRNVAGDRVELDIGQPQLLTVLARVGKKPLPITTGEDVDFMLQRRSDLRVPRDVFAIKTPRDEGIAQAVIGDDKPVTMSLPMFNLVARQVLPGTDVYVTVSGVTRDMKIGETAVLAGTSVTIIDSLILNPRRNSSREGSPYVINLLVSRLVTP